MLRIKMVKSLIGQKKKNRLIIASLGLHKMGQTVVQPDNGSIRGMVHHVKHMLEVEVIDAPAETTKPAKAKKVEAAPAEAPAKPKRTKKSEEPATA